MTLLETRNIQSLRPYEQDGIAPSKRETILQTLRLIPQDNGSDSLVERMYQADSTLLRARRQAESIFIGEGKRIEGVGECHNFFGFTWQLLTMAGIPQHSLTDVGTGFGLLPLMLQPQPDTIIGIDDQPAILAVGTEVRNRLPLPQPEFKAIEGSVSSLYEQLGQLLRDPGDPNGLNISNIRKSDVSAAVLLDQYDDPHKTATLLKHTGDTQIHVDLPHGASPVSNGAIERQLLPMMVADYPDRQAYLNLQLVNTNFVSTPFGKVYDANFVIPKDASGRVVMVGENRTKVTVFIGRDGKEYFIPWAATAKSPQFEAEFIEISDILRTLAELYLEIPNLPKSLDKPINWGANNIALVPEISHEQGDEPLVLMNKPRMSVQIGPSMILRHLPVVSQVAEKGWFTKVGENKPFANIGELIKACEKWVRDPDADNKVDFESPPLMAVMTSTTENMASINQVIDRNIL